MKEFTIRRFFKKNQDLLQTSFFFELLQTSYAKHDRKFIS